MNIQQPQNLTRNLPSPSNFIEATVALATCYKNALAAGVAGDHETTRYWVDASRTVKSFFKRYQEQGSKENLILSLEKSGGKKILAESLKVLKQAEPFIAVWASKFRQLEVRDFSEFQDYHWDIFLDEVVPLTWDWDSDLFIIQHSETKIVETLIQRGQKRILIIEPNKTKSKKLSKQIGKLRGTESVAVISCKEEIKRHVSVWIDKPPHVSRVISSTVMPDEDAMVDIKEIQDIAREGMINAITFDITIKSHDQVWVENGLGNFENLVKHSHVACLKNKFCNSSVIIVSPGPSLEKNVELLKEVKGKAIIVAVSHSLEFLKAKNIVPDVVIHVDPNVNIDKYFEGIPFEEIELLILSATTDPSLFNLPTKNKAWLYANAYFDNWLMELLDIEDYTLWGSCVSVAALKLCYTWGCRNIVLIGQDLSFKPGEYYAGSSYAPQEILESFDEASREEHFKLPGYYGGEVVTKNDYRLYHSQFVDLAKDLQETSSVQLFNCTEGGANIEGFQNRSLKDFLDSLEKKNGINDQDNFGKEISELLVETSDRVKVRNNIIKTKRLLVESQKLLKAALKKVNSIDLNNIDSTSIKAIQKRAAKKLKSSMFLKIALQDALSDISSDESYEYNQQGYLKKVAEMYKACLSVIDSLRIELNKLKLR